MAGVEVGHWDGGLRQKKRVSGFGERADAWVTLEVESRRATGYVEPD